MKSFLLYTALFLVALLIGGVLVALRDVAEAPGVSKNDEWCLVTTLDSSGGSFGSNRAGEFDYQVIATMRGYEVYRRCNQ